MSTLTDSTLTTTFGNCFNTRDYSDCKIIFKKSNKTLQLHKFVICHQSLYFKTHFASETTEPSHSTIEIDEDDERLLTDLLHAMYSAKLTINDSADIVPLLLLARKYKIITWMSQLDKHLAENINATTVLQCLQLDLDTYANIKQAFHAFINENADAILDGDRYLKLNKDHFTTMLELLVNKDNQLKGFKAVQTWIEHDEEERAMHSFALSKLVKSVTKV
jgi:hypothetical protein